MKLFSRKPPKPDGENKGTPMNKWMIWGFSPYFWFPTHFINLQVCLRDPGHLNPQMSTFDFCFYLPVSKKSKPHGWYPSSMNEAPGVEELKLGRGHESDVRIADALSPNEGMVRDFPGNNPGNETKQRGFPWDEICHHFFFGGLRLFIFWRKLGFRCDSWIFMIPKWLTLPKWCL